MKIVLNKCGEVLYSVFDTVTRQTCCMTRKELQEHPEIKGVSASEIICYESVQAFMESYIAYLELLGEPVFPYMVDKNGVVLPVEDATQKSATDTFLTDLCGIALAADNIVRVPEYFSVVKFTSGALPLIFVEGWLSENTVCQFPAELFSCVMRVGTPTTGANMSIATKELRFIHSSVDIVPDYFCIACTKLTDVRLNFIPIRSTECAINKNAFEECTALSSVQLSGSPVRINYGAFCGCKQLTEIIGSENISYLDSMVFYGSGLRVFKAGQCLQHVAENAFDGCHSLQTVDLTESRLRCVSTNMFTYCESLQEIKLPSGLHTLEGLFEDCPQMPVLFLPDSLESITAKVVRDNLTVLVHRGTSADRAAQDYAKYNQLRIRYVD